MPQENAAGYRINASPTKEFFIHMITRDVPLTRAILDLVDNCVDGARREKPGGDYEGLWVRIELSRERFRIVDNCGGIPVEVAREYAFRFGRPPDAEETRGSIGQFGVGMKRSFFKLGRVFMVESKTSRSRFLMNVDVERWMAENGEEKTNDWHFQFDEVEENINTDADEIGTKIEIQNLFEAISESFDLETFRNRLIDEISAAHSLSMDRGIAITVNAIPVQYTPHKLLQSEALRPAFLEKVYERKHIDGKDAPPVHVKLYAGVGERNIRDGGWYIFCNGRLVLGADHTSLTVWGSPHNIPQYHADYAYFRGYAFFDSDHAALLPWTTTKTGIDVDSRIYQVVQQEMIELTKPVIEFLKRLEKERRSRDLGESDDEPLQQALNCAREQQAEKITELSRFVSPQTPPPPPRPRVTSIQYSKSVELVAKAKRLLGVTSNVAVGERTFEYFMKNEGDE